MKKLKAFFLVVLFLVIIILSGNLVYEAFFKSNIEEITISNSELHPKFSPKVTDYVVYTNQDEVTISCISEKGNYLGCNETIKLQSNETSHVVYSNRNNYTITIYKQAENTFAGIKIKEINGISETWQKENKITVKIENGTKNSDILYSFDGGSSWQKSNSKIINNNSKIKIVVKDSKGYFKDSKSVEIKKIDNSKPEVQIYKSSIGTNKFTIKAVAVDNESGVKSYRWSTGSTSDSITVSSFGKYSVTVTDYVGNSTVKNVEITNDNNEEKNVKTFAAVFDMNGSSGKSEILDCSTENTSCNIETPTIKRNNYEIIGWSKNKNSKDADVKPNEQLTISSDVTYYAITRKNVIATFNKRNVNGQPNETISCYLYNRDSKCTINSPKVLTQSGFNALGWSTTSNATSASIGENKSIILTGNVTYYSITKSNSQYTATFNKNNASAIGSTSQSCYRYNGSSSCNVKTPSITAQSGYSISGWGTSANATSDLVGASTNVSLTGNITYYAITKSNMKVEYTATFNKNGASNVGSTTLKCVANSSGSCTITTPSITAASGFTVLGWGTSASATSASVEVSKTITLKKNVTYYAITKSSSPFTVTFNKNGSSSIGFTSQSCDRYNGASSCNIKTPSIKAVSGFNVLGWGTSANATTSSVDESKSVSLTKNTVYYAITRSKSQYTATFNKNKASSISSDSLSCYRYNGATSCNIKTPNIVAMKGFKVLGWGTNASSTSNLIGVSTTIELTKNITYYAITQSNVKIEYTATFNKNGASSIGSTSLKCTAGSSGTCTVTAPNITAASGFSVLGWGTSENATSASVEESKQITLKGNATYYAITKSTLTATFNKNGASSISSASQKCNRYNGALSCTITSPSITATSGFTALGWGTSANATGASVGASKQITLTGNVTYYAISKSNSPFTVTFNKNGASSISSTSQNCDRYNGATSCTITSPSITPASGFSVLGWGTSANATSASIGASKQITLTGNATYYAVTKSTLTATFNKNKASAIGATSQSCNRYNGATSCNITTPSITAPSGSSVLGWGKSTSATSGLVRPSVSVALTGNITYYAIIKTEPKVEYTATFNKNGANSIGATSLKCTASSSGSCTITTPTITAASGFSVVGWGSSASATSASVQVSKTITLTGNVTYYAITRSTLTATFNKNKASAIGATSQSCNRYNGATSCNITTPSITAPSGSSVLGWGTSASATIDIIKPSASVALTGNITYYAIIKTEPKVEYTATFNKNGANSIGATSLKCTASSSGSCTITTPAITAASGFSVVGWGSSASATSASVGASKQITLTGNATYYAITKSSLPFTVTFNINYADSIGSYSQSCYRYNGASRCNITTPSITPPRNHSVVGWGSTATAKTESVGANTTYSIGGNQTLYAIVKGTMNIIFNKNTADSLGFYSSSCTSWGFGCKINDIPHIYSKGNEIEGFSYSLGGGIYYVLEQTFFQDTILYAKKGNDNHHVQLPIHETYYVNGMAIDLHKSNKLDAGVLQNYVNEIRNMYRTMPELFHARAKISLIAADTFTEIWDGGAGGLTYGYREYSNIDIPIDYNYDEYRTSSIIHELGHAFDWHYAVRTGKLISEQPDVLALYNKYKGYSQYNRPMRNYSYNEKSDGSPYLDSDYKPINTADEFWADAVCYYYYQIFNRNVTNPKGGNEASVDILNTVARYLNYAKNGYK